MRVLFKACATVLGVAVLDGLPMWPSLAQTAPDALWRNFVSPPSAAKPRVWWHWMNGNISKEGIKLDLEWMQRAGLGGFQVFDAALQTPQMVDNRLVYMTPEWKDAFNYATVLAYQLDLEEAIAGSPGWSESGAPWVPASHGMKKYVWSASPIAGGQRFIGKLAHPPSVTGAFQNLPVNDVMENPVGAKPTPEYYSDSVVIAYRKPTGDIALQSLHPRMSSSTATTDFALLTDGDLNKAMTLTIPTEVSQSAWIQYEFSKPQTRSVRSHW
jgi:hypothetical protein